MTCRVKRLPRLQSVHNKHAIPHTTCFLTLFSKYFQATEALSLIMQINGWSLKHVHRSHGYSLSACVQIITIKTIDQNKISI